MVEKMAEKRADSKAPSMAAMRGTLQVAVMVEGTVHKKVELLAISRVAKLGKKTVAYSELLWTVTRAFR